MVTSVDGRATVNGRVGDLTGDADQKVLLGVRELAAAVVVGGRHRPRRGLRPAARRSRPGPARGQGTPARARARAGHKDGPGVTAIWKPAARALPGRPDRLRGRPDGARSGRRAPACSTSLLLSVSPRIVGGDAREARDRTRRSARRRARTAAASQRARASLFLRYGLDVLMRSSSARGRSSCARASRS